MKKFLLILKCLVLTLGLTGCSNDDNSIDENNIFVNFLLQDENGVEKYIFYEGENIVFRLDIINNGEEDVTIHSDIGYFIGNDVFHVYSSKGEDFGTPYDMLIIPEVGLTTIPSNSRISILCPWVNDSNSGILWNPRYLNYVNYEIDKLRPLTKGDYNSQFTIRLNDNRFVTCKRTFKIE